MTPATAWSSFPFAAPPAAPAKGSTPPPPASTARPVAGFGRATAASATTKKVGFVAGFARTAGGK